jgi:hypothetical protein
MAEDYLLVTRERLIKLLQKSYEQGCHGWPELAAESAEQMVKDTIDALPAFDSDLNEIPKAVAVEKSSNTKDFTQLADFEYTSDFNPFISSGAQGSPGPQGPQG